MLAMYPPHIIPDDDSRSCSQCRIQRQKRRRLERFAVRLKKHIEAKDKEMKSLNEEVQMLENVLRNVAERAAHEIAWMHEETDLMIGFADEVETTLGKSDELTAALSAYKSGRSDSLHLDDVSKTYGLAGECFSVSMERVFAASHKALHLRSREILAIRLDHENKIMGEWAFVGRG